LKALRFKETVIRIAALAVIMVLGITGARAADAPPYPIIDCGKFSVQADLNQCNADNLQSADKALNKVYQALMAEQDDAAAKERLKAAERAWIVYRDRQCDFEAGPQETGGSMWPTLVTGCLEYKTAERIRELMSLRTCTAGVSVCDPH
jgi:uncharacterized protein YecT (DUF1311 family)